MAAIDFERDLDTPKVSKSKSHLTCALERNSVLMFLFLNTPPSFTLIFIHSHEYSCIVMFTLLCPGWRSSHRGITRISRVRMTDLRFRFNTVISESYPPRSLSPKLLRAYPVYPLYKLACSVTEVGTILQIWWRRELGTDPGGENLNEKIATGRG